MPAPQPERARLLGAAAALAGLYLALVLPNHPGAATPGALAVFPLELPVIVLALALASGRVALGLRAVVTAALAVMVLVKLGDLVAQFAFGRASSPVFDLPLVVAGARLAHGALGAPATAALGLGIAVAVAALTLALWRATGRLTALAPSRGLRLPAAAAALAALALVAADLDRRPGGVDPPGAAFTTRLGWDHARAALRAPRDLAAFRAAAAEDASAAAPPEAILTALRGRDVFLVFVESYGRAALDDPEIGATIRPTLAELGERLAASDLAVRSGYVASPVVGGQSWLAHVTTLSGLVVDSQARYRALLASPRRTLLHLAGAAGWRVVAVMPAITLAWPEGGWFGYDRVLAAADLGYDGPAFGWVTMPDQFTFAALERAELDRPDRAPVFAEIALISSHAPFTPVPRLLPWEALGDGRVFADQASAGPTPEAVWRDPARVRDQYRRALDYSLRAVAAFAERRAGEGPLFVVLGDHQPAPIITGAGAGRDVPAHVIGPPELVERLAAWGWAEGMAPDPAAPAMPMADLRDRLLATFAFTGDPSVLVSEK